MAALIIALCGEWQMGGVHVYVCFKVLMIGR